MRVLVKRDGDRYVEATSDSFEVVVVAVSLTVMGAVPYREIL